MHESDRLVPGLFAPGRLAPLCRLPDFQHWGRLFFFFQRPARLFGCCVSPLISWPLLLVPLAADSGMSLETRMPALSLGLGGCHLPSRPLCNQFSQRPHNRGCPGRLYRDG
jgi:hypothetical protein